MSTGGLAGSGRRPDDSRTRDLDILISLHDTDWIMVANAATQRSEGPACAGPRWLRHGQRPIGSSGSSAWGAEGEFLSGVAISDPARLLQSARCRWEESSR